MEYLLQNTSLLRRAYWLVKLRWAAIGALGIATFAADRLMGISLPASTLYTITAVLLVYNFLLFDFLKYSTSGTRDLSPRRISLILSFQMSVDLLILTTIIHFSGGIENPFSFFFVFHMILASILCSRKQSYFQATLAVVLWGTMVLLECYGRIEHHPLIGFSADNLYSDTTFVMATLFVFAVTLFLVVYMTTSISEQLGNQQENLEQANTALKQKDTVMNEYVLRITHDIKGHLAATQSCLGLVEEETVGPLNPKQKDLIERASRRTSKCMAFVTGMLKLTRMKLTGKLQLAPVDIKNLIFDAITTVEERARKKSITICHDIDSSVSMIEGESVLIEETVTNLLFNAVRYTPQQGRITLDVRNKRDQVLIQIKDTGIGIPPGDEEKVFEEFYRADNARSVERDGTGLGLSFAKRVVERHGGKIWAANNPDGGSTFSLTLPLKSANGNRRNDPPSSQRA